MVIYEVTNGDIIDTLRDVFSQIAAEAAQLIPRIFIALIIIAIAFIIIHALNYGLRKILKFTNIDELFSRLSGFVCPSRLIR